MEMYYLLFIMGGVVAVGGIYAAVNDKRDIAHHKLRRDKEALAADKEARLRLQQILEDERRIIRQANQDPGYRSLPKEM